MKLPRVYVIKKIKSPELRKLKFSYAKVEKVVKPPQIPTVANNRISD